MSVNNNNFSFSSFTQITEEVLVFETQTQTGSITAIVLVNKINTFSRLIYSSLGIVYSIETFVSLSNIKLFLFESFTSSETEYSEYFIKGTELEIGDNSEKSFTGTYKFLSVLHNKDPPLILDYLYL